MDYRSPDEREADRRRRIADIQEQERNLRDNTRKREKRYCKAPGCGMPFQCPPGSGRLYCTNHDHLSFANYQ